MNNSDLIWRLVEIILQKEKELNQLAIDNDNKTNDSKQNEVQPTGESNIALPQCYITLFYIKKELNATAHLILFVNFMNFFVT